MPAGLKEECCKWVRMCMHEDPNMRPTASDLTQWLDQCRRDLRTWIVDKDQHKVSGAEMAARQGRIDVLEYVTILSRRDAESAQYWSDRGRYSLKKCRYGDTKTHDGHFILEVREETEDEWLEMALTGNEMISPCSSKPSGLGLSAPMPAVPRAPFGLVFRHKDKTGTEVDTWPRVARIDAKVKKTKKDTIAGQFPGE